MGETYHRWANNPKRSTEKGAETSIRACKACGMEKVTQLVNYFDNTTDLLDFFRDPRTGAQFQKAGQCPGLKGEEPDDDL
jgi:hypothetical protein